MTKTSRFLPVTLDEQTLAQRADDLAKQVILKNEVESEKKDANAEFNAKIKMHNTVISQLATTVETGIEEQEVACEWVFHSPLRGMKQLIRLDTNEVVDELDMTDKDKTEFHDSMQMKISFV